MHLQTLSIDFRLQGTLRVNSRNYQQAFIANPNKYNDIYVPWRNRAFNGDVVAVLVFDRQYSAVYIDDIERYLCDQNISLDVKQPSAAPRANGQYWSVLVGRTSDRLSS